MSKTALFLRVLTVERMKRTVIIRRVCNAHPKATKSMNGLTLHAVSGSGHSVSEILLDELEWCHSGLD